MAASNLSKSLLIVPYEWILENVEKDLNAIASNVILFRGERVFRVALKNSENKPPTLLFLAMNLNKIGLRIADVVCGKEGVDTLRRMDEKKPIGKQEEIHSKGGHLQLFICNDVNVVIGEKCTFVFQIHLEGIIAGSSYSPCDLLAKEQLWLTVNNKLRADVEFIVQDKRFSAHKATL